MDVVLPKRWLLFTSNIMKSMVHRARQVLQELIAKSQYSLRPPMHQPWHYSHMVAHVRSALLKPLQLTNDSLSLLDVLRVDHRFILSSKVTEQSLSWVPWLLNSMLLDQLRCIARLSQPERNPSRSWWFPGRRTSPSFPRLQLPWDCKSTSLQPVPKLLVQVQASLRWACRPHRSSENPQPHAPSRCPQLPKGAAPQSASAYRFSFKVDLHLLQLLVTMHSPVGRALSKAV